MTSGEEKLESAACRSLAHLDALDEALEMAILLNYHRLNLALRHAPRHFAHLSELVLNEDEETALSGFDAAGFSDLGILPELRKVRVESMQRQDLALLLETLAMQAAELFEFSTVLPLTRVPRVDISRLTVRRLVSHNWDSVVPYLKFWNCFQPEGLREMKLVDLYSVLLPSPLAYFPYLETLSITAKHKIFSMATFFGALQASDSLRELHFESRVSIGDYSPANIGLASQNRMDFGLLSRLPFLERVSFVLPVEAVGVDSLHSLAELQKLRKFELTGATKEMAGLLGKVFPEGQVSYEEIQGRGSLLMQRP